MAKVKSKSTDTDELANIIAGNLNKLFKGEKVAYAGTDDGGLSELTEFASTGSTLLDLAVSNRPDGGLPFGKIVEISSLEGVGKSLICTHVMKSVQDAGGIVVVFDTENAYDMTFVDAIGVNRHDRFVYSNLNTLEDIFLAMENIIENVRSSDKNQKVLIVLDSIAGATTKQETEEDFSRKGFATGKSLILSQALRKITSLIAKENILLICTNQLRMNLNAMGFGADQYITPGGKALPFHASVRIRLVSLGKITVKDDKNSTVVGMKVEARVVKNRCGPPHRKAFFEVLFDRGVDDNNAVLTFCRDNEIITGSTSAKLKYITNDGEEKIFSGREWPNIWASELRDEIYKKVVDKFVMLYRTSELTDEDVSLDMVIEE